MKKLLTLTAVGALLTTPANAVQKCVALDANVNGTSYDQKDNEADWSVTFPNVTVKGIGVCGSNAGKHGFGSLSENVTYDYDSSLNYNCWCRIISPVVSSWWTVFDDGDPGTCLVSCSYMCADSLQGVSSIRSAIFGSLSN